MAIVAVPLVCATHASPQDSRSEPKKLPDGRFVQPPVLLESPEPTCPKAGLFRGLRQRSAEVYLMLPVTGVPEKVRAVRGAGKGLDEAAVAAVQSYRFRPATIEGAPVNGRVQRAIT